MSRSRSSWWTPHPVPGRPCTGTGELRLTAIHCAPRLKTATGSALLILSGRRRKSGRQSERLKIAGMPFKSKAQRRKFAELLVTGKISDQTYEEWNRSTGSKTLPERIHPKAERGSNSKKRTTSKTKTKKAGSKSKARKR